MTNGSSKLPSGIRQVSSGKFQIRYTGPDGKRYSGGTYQTKTDARTALAIIQASISDRSWKTKKARLEDGELSGRSTLSEWSEEWIRNRTSKKSGQPLAIGTQRFYLDAQPDWEAEDVDSCGTPPSTSRETSEYRHFFEHGVSG